MLFIRYKRNAELVLVAEGFLGLHRVGGDTQNGGPAGGEGARQATEVHRLARAPRCACTRIEKDHDFAAGEVGQRDRLPAVTRQDE